MSRKMKAPSGTEPRPAPPLTDALAAFLSSQDERRRHRRLGHLDLSQVVFSQPVRQGHPFQPRDGVARLPAHHRRHLEPQGRVARGAGAAEQAGAQPAQ